jgi:hypothetical protein
MALHAKLTGLLAAVLTGFFVLLCGAAPASAHAGHDHFQSAAVQAPAPVAETFKAIPATASDEDVQSLALDAGSHADLTTTPNKTPAPLHQGNCCCGSIACHAGVEAAVPVAVKPFGLSAKVELVPAASMAKFNPHGIDRPPRSPSL